MVNDKKIFIIVGLGNPGKAYIGTRHNIGFDLVLAYAQREKIDFQEKKRLQAKIAEIENHEKKIILAMPQTYMNHSGTAVKKIMQKYQAKTEELLVIVDDLNLPFGQMRLKPQGSHGGHNGLKNISHELGSDQYPRLRLGVGSPTDQENFADFVLERFSPPEKMQIPAMISGAIKVIDDWQENGIIHAMNQANAKINKDLGDKE